MPSFQTDGFATPIGRNVYLRSTQDVKTDSRTFAASTVPAVTIDGHTGQKVLQPGTVLALITSGPDAGKVGPFQDGGTDEVQTLTEGTAISAGTFDLTVLGVTVADIAYDVTAAALQTAVRAAIAASDASDVYKAIGDSLTVTGGPVASTPFTFTFNGELGADVPAMTVDVTGLTGTITVATGTPGVAGATDGRQTTANIVGICNTFLPWQLIERDVEVAVVYEATVYQSKCLKLNTAGAFVALDDTTAAAMDAEKHLKITFALGTPLS